MNPADKSEAAIFEAALACATAQERAAYLDKACAGQPELRQRVEALLAAHEEASKFLEPKAAATRPTIRLTMPPEEQPGERIGRYKLLQKIGEGGCGVVYMAEQEEPVRRRVALKVIKLGMDTKQVVARFEAERQALALMDHPNIAKVLDAGATEAGRPFFVMELVKGIPATRYADENKLDTRQRLDLFIQICQAVQHAHQKGIIHRDLKPSNVLVADHDGTPVPKVIDFGIAKATTDQRLTDKTLFTALEQFIGTPAYMSPEQAKLSGLDVDTRSDIYSLGVLLYELLTGKTPFDARRLLDAGFDEIRRIIREEEPPKPSTRLTQELVADEVTRRTPGTNEPSASSRRRLQETISLVRGDLDWIVMKCLEKDRTRRYETANGLAADVQRHLSNEPVVACPPSAAYRFQKMVRRNKLAFATAGMVLVVLLAGVIGTSIGFVRAEQHRRAAEENFNQARSAVGDLLAVADNDLYDAPGMQALRVKLMSAVIDRYKVFLAHPNPDPAVRAELARVYAKYGFAANQVRLNYETVIVPAYQSALAIQRQLVREQPANREIRFDLGYTLLNLAWGRNHRDVVALHVEALKVFGDLVQESPTDPLARADYARALGMNERWSAGDPDYPKLIAETVQRYELLVQEFPMSAELRRDLAYSMQEYARVGPFDSQTKITMLARVIELRRELVKDMECQAPGIWLPARPRDSAAYRRVSLLSMKRDVAFGFLDIAREHVILKQWPEVLSAADNAAVIYRTLVEQNPSVSKYHYELIRALDYGAQGVEMMGDLDEAKARKTEAAKILNSVSSAGKKP